MTALITGASSGIGLELARVFAARKHDVVLVARSERKLSDLAREVTSMGAKALVLPADLSKPGAAADVVAAARAAGHVDVLVNNAGYGLFGPFVETDWAVEHDMIELNVVALTELTKRVLPDMVARRSGRILNLASTAAFFPGPLMAVYYATKAYVLSFTEALANELEGTGVTVTALCPGPTASGFQTAANLQESKLVAGRKLPTSREVAEFGYDALMRGETVAIPGAVNKLTAQMHRFLPRRMVARAIRSVQEKR